MVDLFETKYWYTSATLVLGSRLRTDVDSPRARDELMYYWHHLTASFSARFLITFLTFCSYTGERSPPVHPGPAGLLSLRRRVQSSGDRRPGVDVTQGRPSHDDDEHQAGSGSKDLRSHQHTQGRTQLDSSVERLVVVFNL